MDCETLAVYNAQAPALCAHYRNLIPAQLYDTVKGFFHRGGTTADIGCGSGRDVAWLTAAGYPTLGYDASDTMIAEAHVAFPGHTFTVESLPDLSSIPSDSFANILCSGVLMHLKRENLITAVMNLARVLEASGRLLLSLRDSLGPDERESDGRLFTSIPTGKLVLLLESVGFRVVSVEHQADTNRPEVIWTMVLAEIGPLDHACGLERIQQILVQDAKTATYKLALVRALCRISRTQAHLAEWTDDVVYVPMWSVALEWLAFYWPLLTAPEFVAQIRGESAACAKPLAFRSTIQALAEQYGTEGLWNVLRDVDNDASPYLRALRKIAHTIEKGPVTFAGTRQNPIFHFVKTCPGAVVNTPRRSLGWIGVPESIWLDICRFDHWIEDSVIMRWASLSAQMNPGQTLEQIIPYLVATPNDERDTSAIHALLNTSGHHLECVWTGQSLRYGFHVDHLIPYAVWGNNDYWNLLPCHDRVNLAKSDAVPTLSLIHERADCIVDYWRQYRHAFTRRFDQQISRALGCQPGTNGWEDSALAGLQETIQRMASTRGLAFWRPSGRE